tara:strand:+ start:574 stop:747 length:174 start_codon:yes stop_codon:yes gene_type:complete
MTKRNLKQEKIVLAMKWEELLPMYASIYSSLNNTGKIQVQKELKLLGQKVDKLNSKQ